MPTYQYACTRCQERFEVVQSFSDASLTECPSCQGPLRKLYNAVGIVFKGSGFYRTDSRSGSSPATSGSSTSSGSSTGSADGTAGSSSPSTGTGSGSSSGSSSGSGAASKPAASAAPASG